MHSKRIKISYSKTSAELVPKPVTDATRLASIVDKFRKKYGPTYYSDPKRFDVAVELTIP